MRLLASAVLVATALTASSCGDDDASTPENLPPAGELVTLALTNAREADSYYLEFAFSPEGEDFPVMVDYDQGKYYERFDGGSGLFEIVTAGGFMYTRCEYDADCESWTRREFEIGVPSMGGLTTTMPETLGLTALELAHSWETVSTDGAVVTLRGSVHPVEMINENRRVNALTAGWSGEEINAANEEQHDGDPAEIPDVIIEASIDTENFLPRRVTVITPGALSDSGEDDPYFYAEYSRFGDVTVTVPKKFGPFAPGHSSDPNPTIIDLLPSPEAIGR